VSQIAIQAYDLHKLYKIGTSEQSKDRLGEQLSDVFVSPFRRMRKLLSGQSSGASDLDQSFWALRNISFEINQGEVVAILGRNGAGKSTLLKILSRITAPTRGYVNVYGRVSSLLEVGTGFHPELTGRENIYLNGSILGMKKVEIDRKFDAIVDFAEIDAFVDTPVKHYSSGMYVRLAFSVAAHLEPEILLVDEVLAVGDMAFQKKCLGKMDDVSKQGRTVIFVSHNMNAVQRLCPKAILLSQGEIVSVGDTPDVVAEYLADVPSSGALLEWIDLADRVREGTGTVRFAGVMYKSDNATIGWKPYSNGPLEVSLDIISDTQRTISSIAVTIYDRYGTKLVNVDTMALGNTITLQSGHNRFRLCIEKLYLNPGIYNLGLWVANPPSEVYDSLPTVAKIEVVELNPQASQVHHDGAVLCHFHLVENTEINTASFALEAR
jgi:lipopolysaccharide transport system ATP-binding protein